MMDYIDSHRIMPAHKAGDFDLCTDTVAGGDCHGIIDPLITSGKASAELPKAADNLVVIG